MEYILGLLSGVVFFAVLGAVLYTGYRMGQKKPPVQSVEVDETEQQKVKQYDKFFKEIWMYDVDTALQRKKVTDE